MNVEIAVAWFIVAVASGVFVVCAAIAYTIFKEGGK